MEKRKVGDDFNRFGLVAMQDWFDKKPLSRLQAAVVGWWLVQAGAIAWLKLPHFIRTRGRTKTREWYDDP